MACYKPIHIHKQANGFVAFDIPCGRCEACLRQKRNDHFVRVWQEYQACEKRVVFTTLTYAKTPTLQRNPQVPIYDDNGVQLDNFGYPSFYFDYSSISCWDKSAVKRFLKTLKERCKYHVVSEVLGIPRLIRSNGRRIVNPVFKEKSNGCNPLRYSLVCERGHADIYYDDRGHARHGTHRPHYHALFFIQTPLLSTQKVLDLINELWIYGYVYNELLDRTPQKAFDYVSKYISKDFGEETLSSISQTKDEYKNSTPFRLISNYVGLSLLDGSVEQIEKLDTTGVTLSSSSGTSRNVPLPRYYSSRFTHTVERTEIMESPMYFEKYGKTSLFYDSIDNYGQIQWVDERDYETQSFKRVLSPTTLTPLGIKLQNKHQKNKAESLSVALRNLQAFPSVIADTLSPEHVPFLRSIDIDSFKDYIENEQYRTYDQFYKPHAYQQAYMYVKAALSVCTQRHHQKQALDYAAKLCESRESKSKLFNRYPCVKTAPPVSTTLISSG